MIWLAGIAIYFMFLALFLGIFMSAGKADEAAGIMFEKMRNQGLKKIILFVIFSSVFSGLAHADPKTLPFLGAKSHDGILPTYEWGGLPPTTNTNMEAKLVQAYTAGMDTGRVHCGWDQLEPSPGVFDTSCIADWLATLPSNIPVYFLLETIDSEGYSIPADLKGAGQYELAAGRVFGDSVINARFASLIDAVYPAFAGRTVYLISVGNEPDNYYDSVPWSSQAGIDYNAAMLNFLNAAKTKIHSKNVDGQQNWADVGVAMTLTQGSIQKGRLAGIQPIINASDTFVANYYCWDANTWIVPSTIQVTSAINAMMTAAGTGKGLVLQEVGCPAGYPAGHNPPASMGASVSKQTSFFNVVAQNLRKTANSSKFRAAYAFQLVDWSPTLAHTLYTALANEGQPALGLKVEEAFATIGFIDFTTGAVRSSWNAWLNLVTTVKNCQTTTCTN